MPLTPAFTASQSAAQPSTVVFQDTSTGSDVAVTQRRIYVTDNNGDPVVPSGTLTDYIQWPLATNPITVLSLLPADMACLVSVQWLNVSNDVLYELDETFCFAANNQQNFYFQIQQLGLQPSSMQDTSFLSNLEKYWILIVGAQNAITYADDIAGSQNLLNMATNIKNYNAINF